ncbi:hypothetical protein [Azovibrio restrictus]|uniref:hypothetical protein n=1 Tax=Azovibrio restrictus TaxID=146938 RepID=UPI0026F00F59|nr:hypothetical protein [Azovibrio restrictus]
MELRFELLYDASGMFVYPQERFDSLVEEFDELLDAHQSGGLADKSYVTALEKLVGREPEFIDGHAHLAFAWHEQGKPKKALDAALAGLAVANRLIPEGFEGHIEWGHLDNRPFLRALQGAVLAYVRLRRHREAVMLIEKTLAYNPNDNQGMRYLQGSEALRAGDHEQAQKVFAAEADGYPPYFYELALTHIIKGEWTPAATALRRGFCANPYIAEILGGNPRPQPLAIWHSSNLAEPETAVDYVEMYGDLWRRRPDSLAFVRWLFNHPKVLAERAAAMDCREALLWEQGLQARGRVLDREREVLAGIDDRLSAALVVKREDRRGRGSLYPWMLAFGA